MKMAIVKIFSLEKKFANMSFRVVSFKEAVWVYNNVKPQRFYPEDYNWTMKTTFTTIYVAVSSWKKWYYQTELAHCLSTKYVLEDFFFYFVVRCQKQSGNWHQSTQTWTIT